MIICENCLFRDCNWSVSKLFEQYESIFGTSGFVALFWSINWRTIRIRWKYKSGIRELRHDMDIVLGKCFSFNLIGFPFQKLIESSLFVKYLNGFLFHKWRKTKTLETSNSSHVLIEVILFDMQEFYIWL